MERKIAVGLKKDTARVQFEGGKVSAWRDASRLGSNDTHHNTAVFVSSRRAEGGGTEEDAACSAAL